MHNREIINIRHSEPWRAKVLFVDWLLGNRCNYACSYCPKSLHDGSRPWIQADVLLAFASRILELCAKEDRQAYFQLIGGEVTLIPELPRLLSSIASLGGRVGLISNGSRQLSWWREVRNHLDFVIVTYHPEHASLEHIHRVVEFLSETIRTHVNIAAPPEHFERCLAAAEMFESSCRNISITLKPMLIDFGDQLYPYSDEQLAIFRSRRFRPEITRPLHSVRGEMLAEYEDGISEQMPATEFLTRGLNQWRGWSCNAGIELLSIKETGEVYRALCHEGGPIGHVADPPQFRLPQSAVVCTHSSCVCQTDIMVTRTRRPYSE